MRGERLYSSRPETTLLVPICKHGVIEAYRGSWLSAAGFEMYEDLRTVQARFFVCQGQ